MTGFCVEEVIVEELKEQDLNVTDLLCGQVKIKKQKIKTVKITYHIDNDVREKLIEAGIDDMEELKAALLKCFGDVDVIIEEKIEQC